MKNRDFGVYGKGVEGYVHYKQDFDRIHGGGSWGGGGGSGGCLSLMIGLGVAVAAALILAGIMALGEEILRFLG